MGGVAPFTLYSVTSNVFTSALISVHRRYSDFVWMQDVLKSMHPLNIIPPLPPKQTLGRFDEDFIEDRRRGLEKFLSRVSNLALLISVFVSLIKQLGLGR